MLVKSLRSQFAGSCSREDSTRRCSDILVPIMFVSSSGACFIAYTLVGLHRCMTSWSSQDLYAETAWYFLVSCGMSSKFVHAAPEIGLCRGSRLHWSCCKGSASWPVHREVVEETPPSLICTCELFHWCRASPCQGDLLYVQYPVGITRKEVGGRNKDWKTHNPRKKHWIARLHKKRRH